MATKLNETSAEQVKASVPKTNRLNKILPTDRLSLPKQLEILRAYGALSESSGGFVTNAAVAKIVDMASTTISLSNAFFNDVGFILRTEKGFNPSPEIIAFCHAHEWDQEKAAHKLAPLLLKTWFAQALIPQLKFKPIKIGDAVQVLAETCLADKDYLMQLRMLVDYLVAAGIVLNDNGEIRLNREIQEPEFKKPLADYPIPSVTREQVLAVTKAPTENKIQPAPSAGGISFEINVNVNMAELSGWSAERIASFFNGVAQVMAAKSAVEKEKS